MDRKLAEIADEEEQTLDPSFWDDPKRAEAHLKKIKDKKIWTEAFAKVNGALEDLSVLHEFQEMGEAKPEEVDAQYKEVQEALEDLEFKNMLQSEEDSLSCVLEINAGAGGTESCDWAEILSRMYIMWAEKNDFKVTELDRQDGDVAGIKSLSLEITGSFAFGYLKGENGVHRMVRISPFDSSARRHTSFASVYVYPMVDDSIEIDIKASDIGKAWTTFTVNWTGSGSNPAIGNGSMTGKYVKINKVVHGQILISMGSTTTYGGGLWFFDFPVPATNVFNYSIIGMAAFWDNSASQNFIGFVVPNGTSTTKMQVAVTGAGGTDVTPTVPFTWAVNDRFNLQFTYEAA